MKRPFILLALSLGFFSSCRALAEEEPVRPLRLEGITLNGSHSALTESWVTLELNLANPNNTGRDARVVVFYTGQPELQYARDVWIPPQSSLLTWMLVGPTPKTSPAAISKLARELQALIYDRTGN